MIRNSLLLFLLLPTSLVSEVSAVDWPPASEDFKLYPSALTPSGGILCGEPDYDLMFTLGEEVAGRSENSEYQLWSGFRSFRRVTVICSQLSAIDEPIQPRILSTQLYPVFPNPITDRMNVLYEIRDRGSVHLSIHDVQGRRIHTYNRGRVNPGRYEFTWDGRDNDDNTVATGVYFVRLRVGESDFFRRVVILR